MFLQKVISRKTISNRIGLYLPLCLLVFIRLHIEDSGEQCTVVFALIVTEPASEFECVTMKDWGVGEVGGLLYSSPD
jgi:hypothetical protein